jgi:hypothetical protein
MLGSHTAEPCAVPLKSTSGFLFLSPERAYGQAQCRPVRLVFDWLSEVFGSNNPWFADQFRLNNPPSVYDAGFRKMFNLGGIAETDRSR